MRTLFPALFGILMVFSQMHARIEEVTLQVNGMMCPMCAKGLDKHFKKIKGIDHYGVDIETGEVKVSLKEKASTQLSAFKKAVEDAGFTLDKIPFVRATGIIEEKSENEFIFRLSKTHTLFLHSESHTLSDKTKNQLNAQRGKKVTIEGSAHGHQEKDPFGLSVDDLKAAP